MTEPMKRTLSLRRAIGISGALSSLALSILIDSHFNLNAIFAFLNFSAMLIVYGMSFFLLFASHGEIFLKFFWEACASLFWEPSGPDPKFSEIGRDGEQFALAAGMIGSVVGMVHMLANMSDAGKIGAAMAVALLSIVHGLILGECFFAPIARGFQNDSAGGTNGSRTGLSLLLSGFVFFLFCFFFLLYFLSTPGNSSNNPPRDEVAETSFTEISIETNLANIEEGHTIKLRACFSFNDARTKSLMNELIPGIREKIIQLLLKKTLKDMGAPSASESLKTEVISIINDILKENKCPAISRVIFSEFLTK